MTATEAHLGTVSFRQMKDGTQDDYDLLRRYEQAYDVEFPDRVLTALALLGTGRSGYQVSRLTHSLQTATRAEADGADLDMIVGAVLHDIGDELAPANHSQLAAAMIRPYVRAEVTWVVEMHGVFQFYYYGAFRGIDPNLREKYRDHEWYESCVDFCARWDQAAFDPDYPTKPLEHFEPMLRDVLARRPFDPATGCL